jgi:hypothetical protein
MNYAIISSTGFVVNTIEWDGATFWQPPAGHTAIATDRSWHRLDLRQRHLHRTRTRANARTGTRASAYH